MDEIFEDYKEINKIVCLDLMSSSPEQESYYYPLHTALDGKYKTIGNSMERCNSINRYYEDDCFARAYSIECYEGGIAIFYNKQNNRFYIYILGEDDGSWFIRESWNFNKLTFISKLSEAFSMFNSNFKE